MYLMSCGLPQLSSCGPIEAVVFTAKTKTDFAFRNYQVAAPLKPIVDLPGLQAVCLPQLSSCGPIEASVRITSDLGNKAFRNYQVAAPLKRTSLATKGTMWTPSATIKLRPH